MLGDPQEALDLSQEVFLRVFRTLHHFRGDATLRTWIYRIAVNASIDLKRRVVEKGLTLVPVRVYLSRKGKVKLELAVARGKKLYDKRADIKSRDMKRDSDREIHGGD